MYQIHVGVPDSGIALVMKKKKMEGLSGRNLLDSN